jgi:hypothetical protein
LIVLGSLVIVAALLFFESDLLIFLSLLKDFVLFELDLDALINFSG